MNVVKNMTDEEEAAWVEAAKAGRLMEHVGMVSNLMMSATQSDGTGPLTRARLAAGFTIGELAKELGTNKAAVSEWENGRRQIHGHMAARLDKVLPGWREA